MPITRTITVTEGVSVKDLAEKLDVRRKDLIASLLMRGVFVTVNQSLDTELVKEVSRQFGAEAQVISFEEEMANEAHRKLLRQERSGELEVPRPPWSPSWVTSITVRHRLLDAIRETDVAAGEAGGITQHIGAYKVRISKEGFSGIRPRDRLPGYAGSRSLYPHACTRREGHRHRRDRGRSG